MKKTEKIEIRVSPEEKEALSAASRSEGRTASDVLREYVGRYVEAAAEKTAPPPKEEKMSLISKIAYVALGAVVAIPATMFTIAGKNHPVAIEADVLIRGRSVDQAASQIIEVSTTLPLEMSGPFAIHTPNDGDSGYDVRAEINEVDDGAYDVAFNICWQVAGEECKFVSAPRMTTAFADTTRVAIMNDDGPEIHINLRPVFRAR